MKSLWQTWFGLIFMFGLAACNDTTPTPPPPPSGNVVKLEISPNALLFTQLGEKQQLKARAFNASGQEVNGEVTWTSSRPEQVSISTTGELEAKVALGATQIVAQVGNIKSAPMLVSVAQPAAGVQLITDAQIKSDPTVVDPTAEPSLDNPYEVLLTGISPPAPGSLLLGRESKAIGGEVISSVNEGDAVRVRLKLVSITTLMKTAQIHETIDFSKLEPTFPKDLTDLYDIQVVGDEYNFTPKAKAASARALPAPDKPFEFQLGPFKCELIKSASPLSLSQPAQFNLKFNPTLEIDFDRETGLKKLIVRTEITAKLKASLILSVSGLLNVECELQLYEKLMPLPGWAGLILSGNLTAGLGFEMEGTIALPTIGIELSNETKANLEIGLDCVTGECKMVRKMEVKNTPDHKLITPSLTNLRTEMFVFAYGYAKLKFGMTLVPQVRLNLLTIKAGIKLEGSFATRDAQLAPSISPNDPDYRSNYKLSLLAELTAGPKNFGKTDLAIALQRLGIFKLTLLKFQLSTPLATSPQGTVTQDTANFKAGDVVSFKVKLDPATVRLPIVAAPLIYYNVTRIFIVRKTGSDTSERIASVPASTDQTEFTIPWLADVDSDNALGKEFYAFVDTTLPVPFDLELGKVNALQTSVPSNLFRGTVKLNETVQDDRNIPETPEVSAWGTSSGAYTITLDANVEFNPSNPNANRITSKNATYKKVESSNSFFREIPGGGCSLVKHQVVNATETGSSFVVSSSDRGFVKFTGLDYTLEVLGLSGPISRLGEFSVEFLLIAGACELPPIKIQPIKNGPIENSYFPANETVKGNGTLKTNPDGSLAIVGSSTINQTRDAGFGITRTVNYTLNWNLKTDLIVTQSKPADLELSMIAPASATTEGKLTYAINLHNKSTSPANNIRAEFYLPEGFTITDIQGWSGCTTILTTVTCKLSSLAADERRAFLIDVKAPASGGVYVMSARVSADETDPNLSDNLAVGSTIVDELTP